MRIHFTGTASETIPCPGWQHCCWILESGGDLFCFNAGENASRTAFFMELELSKICAVFIPQITPVRCGGLLNLLELSGAPDRIPVFVPGGAAKLPVLHSHIEPMAPGGSFSRNGVKISWTTSGNDSEATIFLIEAEERRIIYAPGIRSAEEIAVFMKDGIDLLLAGTPFLTPPELCRYLKHRNFPCGKILFTDHTRDTLLRLEEYNDRISDMMPGKASFAEDAGSIEF